MRAIETGLGPSLAADCTPARSEMKEDRERKREKEREREEKEKVEERG